MSDEKPVWNANLTISVTINMSLGGRPLPCPGGLLTTITEGAQAAALQAAMQLLHQEAPRYGLVHDGSWTVGETVSTLRREEDQ
jgi:hypothetical protein